MSFFDQVYRYRLLRTFSSISMVDKTEIYLDLYRKSQSTNTKYSTNTLIIRRLPLERQRKLMTSIMKTNLSWSRTQAKLCQLIASLSVLISFFFALKVRLKDLKFEFGQFKLK